MALLVDQDNFIISDTNRGRNDMKEFYKKFTIVHPYIAFCMCLFGILSNICLIVVLSRPKMRSTVNRLLISIASIDVALMISYSVYLAHVKFADRHECPVHLFTYEWTIFQMLHANFSVYARACTLWLSATVAGYSKYVVALSTPVVQNENSRISKRLTIAVALAVFAAAVPIFIQNSSIREGPRAPLNDTTCPTNHTPYYVLQAPEFGGSPFAGTLLLKITFIMNGIILKFAPCLLLAYFLAFLLYSLYAHKKWRQEKFQPPPTTTVTPANAAHRNSSFSAAGTPRGSIFISQYSTMPTTLILTTILCTTLICELPNAVLSLVCSLSNAEFIKEVYANLGDVLDLLSLLTCTSTSILYCVMSQMFRETFRQLFFHRKLSSSTSTGTSGLHGTRNRYGDYSATLQTGGTVPRSRSASPSFLSPFYPRPIRSSTCEDDRSLNLDNFPPLLPVRRCSDK